MTEAGPQGTAESARPRVLRTLRNVIWNWGGFFFSGFVNFLLAPFVVRHLGNRHYGIAVLIMSLTGYLGLLDLGVRGAVTRYVARFHARSDHEAASRIASSALVLFSLVGISSIFLSILLAWSVPWLPLPEADLRWARILLLQVGPLVGLSFIGGIFSGILMALQRFDHVNAVGVLSTVLRALIIVWVLAAGGGLIALTWIQLGATLATALAAAWISFHLYPQLRIRRALADRAHLRLLSSFSAYSFTLLVFDSLVLYADSLIVGIFLPVSFVTFFWIAANLINYSFAIVGGISKISTPMASALEAQGDDRGLERVLLNGTSYATAVVLPLATTFMLRGNPFIRLWMGPEYADLSGRVLWILSLALVLSASNQVALATMLGISKHEPLVPVLLGQALWTFALGAVLVRPLGLPAVAWATAVPYLAVGLFFWPRYVRRCLGVPVRKYVLSTWVRPGLSVVPFALGTYAIDRLWSASSLVVFFLQTGALLPLALLGFWCVCLNRQERQMYVQTLLQPTFRVLWPGLGRRAGTRL
jgi:O-antigen/teichoic acid export membrane protein